MIRDSSKLRKFQVCTVGCLAVLLIVAASGVALYYWASTPGPQVETEIILGGDSLGLIHVEGLKEDPGLKAMVGSLLVEIKELRNRKLQLEQVPWLLKAFTLWQGSVAADDIEASMRDLPRDVTISLEAVSGESEPQVVAAVNLSRFPRLLKLIFNLSGFGTRVASVDGRPLYRLSSSGNTLAFIDSTVMWAQSAEALGKVLQRDPDTPGTGISEIMAAYRSRDSQWDIYGVILNREGSLAWLLQRWNNDGASASAIRKALESQHADIERISLGIDVVDNDSIQGEVSIQYSNEAAAQRHLDMIQGNDLLPSPLRESEGLDTQQTARLRGREILIELKARNIQATLIQKLEEAWTAPR